MTSKATTLKAVGAPFLLLALLIVGLGPAPTGAALAAHGTFPRRPVAAGDGQCGVEAKGTFAGKRSVEIEIELEGGKLEGELRYHDREAKINFRSTAITNLVVAGQIVSMQGRGRAQAERSLLFSATLDPATKKFGIQLSNGYAASGRFARRDDLEVSGFCPFDGLATFVLDPPGAASGVIGRAGGAITAGNVTLTVPAGALSEDVPITVTPILDLADSPLQGLLIGGVRLEPDGLLFLKPATLQMALPAGVPAADVLGFGSEDDGSNLHLVPREIDGGTILVELWHFSAGGAAAGGASVAAAMQSHQPSAAEQQAQQRIAAATAACAAELAQDIFNGPACANLHPETERALRDWYTSAVRPGLQQAVGAPSFQVEAAMAEWLYWQEKVERLLTDLLGPCGNLQNECGQAHALATAAIADLAQRRLQNCTGSALASQIRDVLRVTDFVVAGAIDLTPGLPDGRGLGLVNACVGIRIEDPPAFPQVAARNRANRVAVRAYVGTYTGAQLTNVPLVLFLDASPGGEEAQSAALDAEGRFETNVYPTGQSNVTIDITVELAPNALPELPASDQFMLAVRESFTAAYRLGTPVRDRVEIEPLAGAPTAVDPGDSVPLKVKVAGDGMDGATVTYSLSGPGSLSSTSGTANADGEAQTFAYDAPPAGSPSGSATVTATFGDTSDSLTIDVDAPIQVTVNPSAAILNLGGQVQFTATVTGANNTAVNWTATGGSITQTGFYTAGSTPGTFTVTAESVEDPDASEGATVMVTADDNLLTGHISQQYAAPCCFRSVEVDAVARVDFGTITIVSATGTIGGTTEGPPIVGEDATGQQFTCPGEILEFTGTISGGRYSKPASAASGNLILTGDGTSTYTSTSADLNEFGEFTGCTSSTTTSSGAGDVFSVQGVHVFSGGTLVAIDFNHVSDFGGSGETLVTTGRLERVP